MSFLHNWAGFYQEAVLHFIRFTEKDVYTLFWCDAFCLLSYLCVCALYMFASIYVETRGQTQMLFLGHCWLFFGDRVSHWFETQQVGLRDCPVSTFRCWDYECLLLWVSLCIPGWFQTHRDHSTGIKDVHHQTRLLIPSLTPFYEWVFDIELKFFPLNYLPGPCLLSLWGSFTIWRRKVNKWTSVDLFEFNSLEAPYKLMGSGTLLLILVLL